MSREQIIKALQKYSKSEVAYSDNGHQDAHCGICTHYKGNGVCEVVSGKVVSGGWCKKFERKM